MQRIRTAFLSAHVCSRQHGQLGRTQVGTLRDGFESRAAEQQLQLLRGQEEEVVEEEEEEEGEGQERQFAVSLLFEQPELNWSAHVRPENGQVVPGPCVSE
jgi:hypothetical protein